MSANATLGAETRGRKRKRERRDANAGEAIPGLLNDIVITHVLRSEYFDDTTNIERFTVVSCAMRETRSGRGRRMEEIEEKSGVRIRCLGKK